MGNDVTTPPQCYGAIRGAAAPFSAAPPSKWRLFNNSVIFQPIWFKFEYKVDRRMGNDVAMPPQRYGAVRGAAAPFLAAPPSKWHFWWPYTRIHSITVIFWANLKGRSYDEVLCNTTAIKLFLVKRPSK